MHSGTFAVSGSAMLGALSELQRSERENLACEMLTRRGAYLSSAEVQRANVIGEHSPHVAAREFFTAVHPSCFALLPRAHPRPAAAPHRPTCDYRHYAELRRDARRAPWPSGEELLDAIQVVHGSALRPYKDAALRAEASLPSSPEQTLRRVAVRDNVLDRCLRDPASPHRMLDSGLRAQSMTLSPQRERVMARTAALSLAPPRSPALEVTIMLPDLAIDTPEGMHTATPMSGTFGRNGGERRVAQPTSSSGRATHAYRRPHLSYSGRGHLVPLTTTTTTPRAGGSSASSSASAPSPANCASAAPRAAPNAAARRRPIGQPFWSRDARHFPVKHPTHRGFVEVSAAEVMESRLERLQRQRELDEAAPATPSTRGYGHAPHAVTTSPRVHAMRGILAADVGWSGRGAQGDAGGSRRRPLPSNSAAGAMALFWSGAAVGAAPQHCGEDGGGASRPGTATESSGNGLALRPEAASASAAADAASPAAAAPRDDGGAARGRAMAFVDADGNAFPADAAARARSEAAARGAGEGEVAAFALKLELEAPDAWDASERTIRSPHVQANRG